MFSAMLSVWINREAGGVLLNTHLNRAFVATC
jgi:hypothetical protein